MKKNRKYKKILVFILLVLLFVQTPAFQIAKSYTIMSIYSKSHESKSFLKEEGVKLKLPGGLSTLKKDYYPFVITFDTSKSFSKAIGEDVSVIVLYNFGAMVLKTGASLMYDDSSSYYNAFYGAYAVRFNELDRQFGLTQEGLTDFDEIMSVTDYDLKTLVMKSVGNKTPNVEYTLISEEVNEIVNIDGHDFEVFNATIVMDSLKHEYEKDYRAYIQYGRPPSYDKDIESFESVPMYGRIYAHFDTSSNISYFFYIIAPTMGTLEEAETSYILKSTMEVTK